MGNLTEQSSWDDNVYQIETADPVLGGPGGIANRQALSLANRTQFLRGKANELFGLWGSLTGIVLPFAGAVSPSGFLLCAGQAVSRTTYANLFAAIGTAYGAGDGSTTFNLPDLRGRAVAGLDNMGGAAAGRLTTAAGGVDAVVLGASGGASTHTLIASQMPAHNHGVTDPGHTHSVTDPTHAHSVYDPGHAHGVNDPGHSHTVGGSASQGGSNTRVVTTTSGANGVTNVGGAAAASGTGISIAGAGTGVAIYGAATGISIVARATGITTQNAGTGGAHPNVQPTIALNYIIKI